MKTEKMEYKCDLPRCNKQIEVDKCTGFPYEKGWTYLYCYNGQILNCYAPAIAVEVSRYNIKDKHFCCIEHQRKYEELIIKKATDSKTDNANEITQIAEGELPTGSQKPAEKKR